MLDSPALTVALALAAGIAAQTAALHLRLPGIVLLLAFGLLLGPDVADVIRPSLLGEGLLILVSFAVAVILFEGGMGLDLGRLRREQRAIRQLLTIGALVTLVGGALFARWLMGWDWRTSILFGTLVIVTGPTVIAPLLRRIKVTPTVATVLNAEGVFIDAVGAIVAVVGLEVALQPSGLSLAKGALQLLSSLGVGALLGVAGGAAIAALLKLRRVIPEGLENVFVLALVLALFHVSDALAPESGIAAVTFAGVVVGNSRSRLSRELAGFKEQLTSLFIGLLFVLLAADVRIADVRELGWAGIALVAAMILVVRPLNVLAGTMRTTLTWPERAFMAWIGPRGIVAAAVASLFAVQLEQHGIQGGRELRAMVFLLIAATVLVAGITGSTVAGLLGVRRARDAGWVILGMSDLGRALGRTLRGAGQEVLGLDTNPHACRHAEEDGLRVIHGNGLEERVLLRAEIDTRRGAIGLTPNDEVNAVFLRRARGDGRTLLAAAGKANIRTAERLIEEEGGQLLFGQPVDVDLWSARLRRKQAAVERYRAKTASDALLDTEGLFLPLVIQRGTDARPYGTGSLRAGDDVLVLIHVERAADAEAALRKLSLEPVSPPAPAAAAKGQAS